jgi:hypothetical protein
MNTEGEGGEGVEKGDEVEALTEDLLDPKLALPSEESAPRNSNSIKIWWPGLDIFSVAYSPNSGVELPLCVPDWRLPVR